jgi:hypothetical protein
VKFLHPALPLALTFSLALSPCAQARENAYDTASKLLMPFASLFAKETKNPNRALSMTLRLETMTDLPPEFAGARVDLALQYPDKLRVQAPILGEQLTIARYGQKLWVTPADKAAALIEAADAAGKLPKPDKKFRLAPFELPIAENQLVFLPALLQVREAGVEVLDGEPCRVLDLSLMPEVARALKAESWAARVWVKADGTPARVTVARGAWTATVRFESVRFQPALPAETWQPAAGEEALQLSPQRYKQLLDAIGGARKQKKEGKGKRKETE